MTGFKYHPEFTILKHGELMIIRQLMDVGTCSNKLRKNKIGYVCLIVFKIYEFDMYVSLKGIEDICL